MALAVSAVRQRVVGAINTALSASGWREADQSYDLFGRLSSDQRMDKGFAVGAPSTQAQSGQQKLTEGVMVVTEVGVRYSMKSRAKAQTGSYDDALDAEASIIVAVMTLHQSSGLGVLFDRATRSVSDDGHVTGEIVFAARHRFALA